MLESMRIDTMDATSSDLGDTQRRKATDGPVGDMQEEHGMHRWCISFGRKHGVQGNS